MAKSSDEVAVLRKALKQSSAKPMLDPLTGLQNRKSFDNQLNKLVSESRASGNDISLVFADVDFFKSFNDTWGHQTGDHVLRLVAEVMDANVKGQDVLARYGGEEFAVILPNTGLDNAVMLADRMRKAIESRRLKKRRTNADLGTITMSMGVAILREGDTADTLVERADKMLYRSKENGRNRVTSDSEFYDAKQGAANFGALIRKKKRACKLP